MVLEDGGEFFLCYVVCFYIYEWCKLVWGDVSIIKDVFIKLLKRL
jgi:hypothetical protein